MRLFTRMIQALGLQDKELALDSALAFSAKMVTQVLSFVLVVLLTRLLGVQEFGVYIFVWSWAQVLLVVGKCGMDMGALRYLPVYHSAKDWRNFERFHSYSLLKITALNALIGAAGYGLVTTLPGVDPAAIPVYIMAFLFVPFMSLIQYNQAAMRALGHMRMGLLPESIIRPALQILMVLALFAAGMEMNAADGMATNLWSAVIACTIALWVFSRKRQALQAESHEVQKAERKREWFLYGLGATLISGSAIILKQTDVIMIGILTDNETTGIYGAATRVAYLATFALTAVNMAIAPKISRLYAQGKRGELQTLLSQSTLLVAAVTVAVIAGVGLLAHWVLLCFGPEFPAAANALRILLAAHIVYALCGPVGFVMSMTGHHHQAAGIFAGTVALNIILNALLIPLWGMEGSALATGISLIACNAAMLLYIRVRLKLDPSLAGALRGRRAAHG